MKIEIWADFTCPFCYIGKRKLEFAIERFEQRENIEIEFKSFELDPEAESDGGKTKHQVLMSKYDMSLEKVYEMTEGIIKQGQHVGLEMQFDNMVHTNTFQAHRLVKYANKNGKGQMLIDLLFGKYFEKNEDIGKREILFDTAREVGLDIEEVDAFLCMNKYAKDVRDDQHLAQELGVSSVPFFIFNETYAVSGAQPTEVFENVLKEIWIEEEKTLKTKVNKSNTCEKSYCIGNECESE